MATAAKEHPSVLHLTWRSSRVPVSISEVISRPAWIELLVRVSFNPAHARVPSTLLCFAILYHPPASGGYPSPCKSIMDTPMPTLSPELGDFLLKNITIVEVISMFAIGAYGALEVGTASLDLFKRYRGLYFFSMQIASWGILLHAIPAQVRYVMHSAEIPLSIPYVIGWYCMVTGQPLVLYSRLHLVVPDIRRVRWVLWMIITNSITMHIPMTVLFYGVTLGDQRFTVPAAVYDRLQVVVFAAQDLIICAIYIREALRALGPVLEIRGKAGRRVIIHLIAINVIVMIMNILLIVAEYKAHFIQVSFKTVVYSVKLKLEFTVLNKLRSLISSHNPYVLHGNGHRPGSRNNSNDSNATDLRRRSSELNIYAIYALISGDRRASTDVEATPPPPNSLEPDPFASSFQMSMQNYETRRTRQRISQMGSTPGFHQVIRETSSNQNIPVSPSPIAESFAPSSLRYQNGCCSPGPGPRCKIGFGSGSSGTSSTVETELLQRK